MIACTALIAGRAACNARGSHRKRSFSSRSIFTGAIILRVYSSAPELFAIPTTQWSKWFDVARTLRVDHQFRGYIHLKTIPEASPDLIAEAGKWADRISINVELPTQSDLEVLAPEKNLARIETSMTTIKTRIDETKAERNPKGPVFAPAGQSTQMIVGATPANDATILQRASSLYQRQHLRRVYYSAFSPIPDASSKLPLTAPPLVREHRLYQADWLMRFYDFDVAELTTPEKPDLPLNLDPKLAWALRNRDKFPLDLNKAPREMLLRVPGLGVRNVIASFAFGDGIQFALTISRGCGSR